MFNLAVIGCGHWGPNHVRVFNSLKESAVLAVADPDPKRLERIREAFPSIRCEHDYKHVLRDPGIDAVVIATPTGTHYPLVRESLLAGKHVLCEKPLCEDPAQARELSDLADDRGRTLMVGHVFLFNPGIVKAKEIVDAGELGDVRYLSAVRTNLGPIRSDVNAAYDLAAHDISIFNWLLNAVPEVVSATGASYIRPGVEDVVSLSLRYPRNVLATILVSWLDPRKVRQITVVGSRKMVTWDDLNPVSPVAVYDKGAGTAAEYSDFAEFLRLSMWDRDITMPKVEFGEPLRLQAAEFLGAVQRGHVERSDGQFAVGVVRVLKAALSSLRENGLPVRVRSVDPKTASIEASRTSASTGGLRRERVSVAP